MLFLLLNTLMFLGTLYLTYVSMSNISTVFALSFGLIGIFILGAAMVLLNLYDSIRNFVVFFSILFATKEKDES